MKGLKEESGKTSNSPLSPSVLTRSPESPRESPAEQELLKQKFCRRGIENSQLVSYMSVQLTKKNMAFNQRRQGIKRPPHLKQKKLQTPENTSSPASMAPRVNTAEKRMGGKKHSQIFPSIYHS